MPETSASLLDRLRANADADSWQRLVDLYTPLIRGWLRRHGLPDQEADDLVQEVLTVVVRRLPDFRRGPHTGSFRSWLRAITVNCLRDAWRARRIRPRAAGGSDFQATLDQLADDGSGMSRLWDEQHDRHVLGQLLQLIKPRFQPATWQAFHRVTFEDIPADQVAAELGISVNAVFIAKSRVLSLLRQEGAGLID